MPQYNTWIELMYDQNQRDIMRYARKAVENGFPQGIFMIDDNWQNDYGNFDFKASRRLSPACTASSASWSEERWSRPCSIRNRKGCSDQT